jgi:hypothetical protein
MASEENERPTYNAIFQLAAQLQALRQEAARTCITACLPEIEDIIGRKARDPRRIERILDQLLDAAFDENVLKLFKKLCRHYWLIDPHAAALYVQAYRELWDEESFEKPRETPALIGTEQGSVQQTEQVACLLAVKVRHPRRLPASPTRQACGPLPAREGGGKRLADREAR